MKALLICPNDRPSAAFYTRQAPLALVTLLGRTTLDRALSRLAKKGVTEVRILSSDRPEEIRDFVGQGTAWGLTVEVIPVPDHLSLDQAKSRYARAWSAGQNGEDGFQVAGMDCWAGETDALLWEKPAQWFDILLAHMESAGANSVGMREASPGVWISTKARVSSKATLVAPCWIGSNAWIGSHATIGPRAIIESDACVDEGAEVSDSHVGPATYVGSLTELSHSFAWGTGLLNWKNESFVELSDAFLLADLGQSKLRSGSSIFGRIAALLAILLTFPIAIYGWLRSNADGLPMLNSYRGVKGPVKQRSAYMRTMVWYELNGVKGFLRRWPQLWSIARGDFAWVGNRPLTMEQSTDLVSDYEHLWLHVAPGLISMADAHACKEPFSDVARAHAAFYTVHANRRLKFAVMIRVLKRYLPVPILPESSPSIIHPLHES